MELASFPQQLLPTRPHCCQTSASEGEYFRYCLNIASNLKARVKLLKQCFSRQRIKSIISKCELYFISLISNKYVR